MDDTDFPKTRQLDLDLTVLREVESTNTYVRDLPGDPGRVAVVVTDNQTSGRGRLGRTWSQPAASGLAISIRFPAPTDTSWQAAFPLLVGAVVCDVVSEETGLLAVMKWPNDILVAGKKVAGVLCESHSGFLIAGIGVNLTYPEEHLPTPQATSLHLHTDLHSMLPDRLVHGIVAGLVDAVSKANRGHLPQLIAAVSEKLATIGQQVRVDFPDGSSRRATATGLGDDGSLLVIWSDGTRGIVVAGDVWHVTPLT